MNIRRTYLIAFIVIVAILQGCKKEEPTKDYLSGALKPLSLPTYVQEGYTKTFCIDTMMTLSRSDGGKVGYYFKDPVTGVYDTLCRDDGSVSSRYFTITAPASINTYSMSFGGYAGEYIGASKTGSFTVVKPGVDGTGSLTNYVISANDKLFVDQRDNRSYYYTDIDGTLWMRQNLAWEGAGRPFLECDAMTDVFGRYYSWEEAQTACPDGWRLPAEADWLALSSKFGVNASPASDIHGLAGYIMGDVYFNGTKMWEYWSTVKISDKSGLSVIPVGYAEISGKTYDFESIYKYSALWTSDSSGEYGIFRYIYQDRDVLYYGRTSKTNFAASVRCVKK